MENSLVTVFILTWNRAEHVIKAVESALNQSYENIEVLVVDNGSTDGTYSLLEKEYPNIKIIRSNENLGCPVGRNYGIEFCEGEFIFFLDDDGLLHEKAVEFAVDCIKEDSSIGIVTGSVVEFEYLHEVELELKLESTNSYQVNCFQGGISLHRKSIYEKIGNYSNNFFYGAEELHMSYRLLDNDISIFKNKNVILFHRKIKEKSDFERQYVLRIMNKFLTVYEFYPLAMVVFTFFKSNYHKCIPII